MLTATATETVHSIGGRGSVLMATTFVTKRVADAEYGYDKPAKKHKDSHEVLPRAAKAGATVLCPKRVVCSEQESLEPASQDVRKRNRQSKTSQHGGSVSEKENQGSDVQASGDTWKPSPSENITSSCKINESTISGPLRRLQSMSQAEGCSTTFNYSKWRSPVKSSKKHKRSGDYGDAVSRPMLRPPGLRPEDEDCCPGSPLERPAKHSKVSHSPQPSSKAYQAWGEREWQGLLGALCLGPCGGNQQRSYNLYAAAAANRQHRPQPPMPVQPRSLAAPSRLQHQRPASSSCCLPSTVAAEEMAVMDACMDLGEGPTSAATANVPAPQPAKAAAINIRTFFKPLRPGPSTAPAAAVAVPAVPVPAGSTSTAQQLVLPFATVTARGPAAAVAVRDHGAAAAAGFGVPAAVGHGSSGPRPQQQQDPVSVHHTDGFSTGGASGAGAVVLGCSPHRQLQQQLSDGLLRQWMARCRAPGAGAGG